MGRLEGKTTLVTGAGSGLGRAAALAMAAEGAAVSVTDLVLETAEETVAEIDAAGGRGIALRLDISSEAEWNQAVAATAESFGPVDALHNNAAMVEDLWQDGPIEDMDVDLWDRTMQVNLRGPMLGCKAVLPSMLERGGGAITNISSVMSLVADDRNIAYASSKAGVNGLTRGIATMYGKRGIRCNAIAPGVMRTPALERLALPSHKQLWEEGTALPRLGLPEDIGRAAAFLASDDAAFITGQVIPVDGGFGMHYPTVAPFARLAAEGE